MPKLAFGDNGEMVAMDDIPVDDSSGYPLVADWKQHELRWCGVVWCGVV